VERQEPQTISFQVSAEEAKGINSAAEAMGVSRSEYIRERVLSPIINTPGTSIEALLRYIVWTQQRLHVAMFSIVEYQSLFAKNEGLPWPALSKEDLQGILGEAYGASIQFMATLHERLLRMEGQITEYQKNPPAEDDEG
jgi:Ribbon-helix-helix protein, copG family